MVVRHFVWSHLLTMPFSVHKVYWLADHLFISHSFRSWKQFPLGNIVKHIILYCNIIHCPKESNWQYYCLRQICSLIWVNYLEWKASVLQFQKYLSRYKMRLWNIYQIDFSNFSNGISSSTRFVLLPYNYLQIEIKVNPPVSPRIYFWDHSCQQASNLWCWTVSVEATHYSPSKDYWILS